MRYPKFLAGEGCIGFAAPSFGCNTEPYHSAFLSAIRQLEDRGYRTKLGPNCFEGCGIGISNTPEKCAEELTEMYAGSDTDIIISCGGGELMCEDLEFIDWERIRRAEPKWFMGYSDNTNFSFLQATMCDTAAVYGPNAAAFGMKPWHPSLDAALRVLAGTDWTVHGFDRYEEESLKDKEHPLEPYNVTAPCLRRSFPEGDAVMEGRLLGGCMDCLANLCGTQFDHVKEFNQRYAADGVVWFLEACDLTVLGMRRAVWQLKNAGWFDHAKGFLIGRPYSHGQVILGLDQYHAVTDILGSFGVPIVMDLDIGHIPPMMPLVVGSLCRAELRGNEFTLNMDAR